MTASILRVPATNAVNSASDDPGDIVVVVARYVLLEPHAGHRLRGDCPFCRSPAPTFIVRPALGTSTASAAVRAAATLSGSPR
ncbi:hypothetical protein ACIA5G_34200 [Amycolatopsis sp. NPDC051758]|uniref:hypothetical protein n=1 Tax=Amycolatopsis sp. NPDC051758 TaxID=3363935 RepID=UPI0037B4173B